MTATGDLRTTDDAEFWDKLHQAMGEDGLLTYRYLGRVSEEMHGVQSSYMKIRRDMRDAHGGIRAGALAIATAETGFTDFNSVPAPVSAGLTIVDPGKDVARVAMRKDVLKVGRTLGFSRTTVTDWDNPDRVIALTRGIGIKLGDAPAEGGKPFPLPEDIADRDDLPPLIEVFGGWKGDDGHWRLPALAAHSRSTSGTLHLGPMHLVFDAAADELAAASGLRVADWEVLFVAAGTNGPFRVDVTPIPASGPARAAEFRLMDEGRGDRLVASASASFGA
ncbi:MAG: hypothetical protein FP826_06360 [Sphingomonadales bacterium]|nr:hypothetical protein [Sphingomonadales bacterium]MBU3994015.1 hypothetical protein [Alphaproteobacteria bacterium]